VHPYHGAKVALTTKHGKAKFVAPAFERFEINIQQIDYDTDQLGTFTGEIERPDRADRVVLRKAQIGLEISGLHYGLASEGSYGPDPQIPLLNSGIELLAWVDRKLNFTLTESLRTFDIQAGCKVISQGEDITEYFEEFAFPSHALIVRCETGQKGPIYKGISNHSELQSALDACWQSTNRVVIENDLRAHMNPTRQKTIALLGKKLADRLERLCRECGTPGWGVVGVLRGARCVACQSWNDGYPNGEIFGCAKCDAREEMEAEKRFLQPKDCLSCNP
jgi:hypothetical protein